MTAGRPRGMTDERGFTLLEMLVALVVLALIMGLLASGAGLLRRTFDRLAERGEELADIALVTDLLQTRLGDAVALDAGPAGRTVTAFDGRVDRLRFVTLALPIAPGGPLVAWQIGMDSPGGLALARGEIDAAAPGFAALDAADRVERQLAAHVTGLQLAYLGRKQGAGTAEWHADWQDQPRLPWAVRVSLAHAGPALPPIIVPIQQAAGTLCPTPEGGVDCEVP